MRIDDETTAIHLQEILTRIGIKLSLRTIMRGQERLGRTFRGSACCRCKQNETFGLGLPEYI